MIACAFVANIKSHKSSRFLDNVTSLSGDKVSFMHQKNDIKYIAMPSKWATINFELVCLINRTCNFRTEAYTEPCETSKMELFCENS